MNDSNKLPREIFNEAVEILDAKQRAEYLASACGADAALREQVEALIQSHEAAGGFLREAKEAPLGSATADFRNANELREKVRRQNEFFHAALGEQVFQIGEPGDQIGRYKLLQQIGEGGCGVVFMAEQSEPIRRKVALKVIKLGMDTKSVIARFEAERQALALMDHPNIAKVLDAGATEIGRPYFVMELVRGVRITEYCDQHNLTTRARLDLFTQVCHAIQHAHQKGIIHRDIKPSNILVTLHDGAPVPKVIDFGIAKATSDQRLTDKTLFTAFEQFMGTPAYMSPEQAEMSGLDIDTRSDIYSLGVLLYELLTGKTPFDAKELLASGLDAMRRTIREMEPARPSVRLDTLIESDRSEIAKHRQTEPVKLTALLRGDLDWIVMKALEKDRTRRYETANGLAADIKRHLSNEVVTARPPTNLYRLQKIVRRNKLSFAAASAVLISLFTGWLVAREKSMAAAQALVAKARAEAAAKTADEKVSETLQQSNELLLKRLASGTNTAQWPESVKALELALVQQPTNAVLWCAKAYVEEKSGRMHEAIKALSQALLFVSDDTGSSRKYHVDVLLARCRLFRQLGRLAEATADYTNASRVSCEDQHMPIFDRQANPLFLDLSPYLHSLPAKLDHSWSAAVVDGRTIADEVKQRTGVDFDVRGGTDVLSQRGIVTQRAKQQSTHTTPLFPVTSLPPDALTGIAANKRFARLHALHSIWAVGKTDELIGGFVLHYADGEVRRLTMHYGQDFRDVWLRDPRPTSRAEVAWTGTSNGSNPACRGVQFFHSAWDNPRPEAMVVSIDLVVIPDRLNYPILMAMTVEEAKPDTLEFWMTRATEASDNGNANVALKILDDVPKQWRDSSPLWNSRGSILERAGRTDDALHAYSTAIALSESESNTNDLKAALRLRSKLLHKLGRLEEAAVDNCRRQNIPLRPSQSRRELIDLSAFYNSNLSLHVPRYDESALAEFSSALQRRTSVEFDIRGSVGVHGRGAEMEGLGIGPQSIIGIPIRQRATRLHLIQYAVWDERAGRIGSYVFHFANGQTEELPIVSGENIRGFATAGALPHAEVLSFRATPQSKPLYFFKVTWENPHPDIELTTFDLVSAMTKSAPRLLAITAE